MVHTDCDDGYNWITHNFSISEYIVKTLPYVIA